MCCVRRGKLVHLPHKEGGRAGEYHEPVYIDIAGPMSVAPAGWKGDVYVIVGEYTRVIYTRREASTIWAC